VYKRQLLTSFGPLFTRPTQSTTPPRGRIRRRSPPLEVQPLILFLLVQKEELRYLEKYHERKEPLQVVWGLDGESDFT
jgi:hypothetical protein